MEKKEVKLLSLLSAYEEKVLTRRILTVFFVIGVSSSMSGQRIGAVNSAIVQTLEKFREMNEDNDDAEIEVALLEFSNGARWLTPDGSVKVENFYWNDLNANGDRHDMGEAFRMLGEKLSSSSRFMQRASGSFAPVLFLMSDSEPTDDYKTHLAKLQTNGWFKASVKVALAIGNDANDHVLQEFTGSKEGVVRVADGKNAGEKLAKMVQFIAVCDDQIYDKNDYDAYQEFPFYFEVQKIIPDDNPLWQALQRIHSECGEDVFFSTGKFKSALADFLNGVGKDFSRLRKRTVEAVELGVYKRLKEAEQSDLERVTRVEIKKLHDDGIDEATAREIVYAFAKFSVISKIDQFMDTVNESIFDDW